MIQTHNLIINSVYTSTPKKLINSEEIIKDLQDEKEYFQESYKKFGIYNRYVSGPEENFEDLSLEACSNLFQKSRISPSEISLLVVL